MWYTIACYSVPTLAALAAVWGLWRRKWYALLPVVVVGLVSLAPGMLIEPLMRQATEFAVYAAPRNLVMTWLLADAAAVASLVSLWAGWSRGHWFWRLAALASVPAALSLVRANEPIALAFVVLPAIAAAAWWLRQRRDRRSAAAQELGSRPRFRWQLRDALLLFIVVGLVALGIRSLVAGPFFVLWEGFATLAAVLILLALSAGCIGGAASPLWRWLSAAICLATIAGMTIVFVVRNNDVLGLAYFFEQPHLREVASGLYLMAALAIPALVGVTSAVYRWSARAAGERKPALLARGLLVAVSAALLAPLLVVGFWMLPPRITVQPLPPSETYDRIVSVGARITPLVPTGRPSAKLNPLIAEAAEALQEPGHVWIDAQEFARHELARQYDLSFNSIQHVSIALEIETARAEARGDYARSVELARLQLRLSDVIAKGGLLLHWHLGRRAQAYGRAAIDDAATHANPAELRSFLELVRQQQHNRASAETALAWNEYWNWTAFGWRDRFFRAAKRLAGEPRTAWLWINEELLREMEQRDLASWRLLETRLAIELYRRDHGSPPDRHSQLVPDYLPQLPLDPWTNQPFIYRRNDDQFSLYSTGADRRDDGGRFGETYDLWRISGYDLDAGYDRRLNLWPRDDATIMGAPLPAGGAGSAATGP